MRVLVTGATGFVGRPLLQRLALDHRYEVRAVSRRKNHDLPFGTDLAPVACIDAVTSWQQALSGIDIVIHTAARVHIMQETVSDPLAEFRRVNVEGTLNLAHQALEAGVRRFIFASSIKVNGEGTQPGKPFTSDDAPNPADPYGISKREAEDGLRRLAANSGMEMVVIRPPLVYGPGVKGNMLRMMRWLNQGIPLPLGAIRNQRSLVALDNLVDLIATCVDHPGAANQTFLAGDGEDLSTSDLLRRMATALGRPARLLPVPAWLLVAGGNLLGKRAMAQRLCGSLQVDISKTRRLLNWTPPVSVDEALVCASRHFIETQEQYFCK